MRKLLPDDAQCDLSFTFHERPPMDKPRHCEERPG